MKGALWFVGLCCWVAVPVGAQVYQCDQPDGSTTFSGSPCAPDAAELDVRDGYKGDARSRARAERLGAEQQLHRQQRELEAERRRATRRSNDQGNPVEERRHWRNMAVSGRVAVGMPEEFVRRSWGDPDRINRSTRDSGTSEQWVYRRDRERTQYIYLKEGVVTSIQH